MTMLIYQRVWRIHYVIKHIVYCVRREVRVERHVTTTLQIQNQIVFLGFAQILAVYTHKTGGFSKTLLSVTGWWFEPLWKILVNWDDYSQYMGK